MQDVKAEQTPVQGYADTQKGCLAYGKIPGVRDV